jgi:hypothetical protein
VKKRRRGLGELQANGSNTIYVIEGCRDYEGCEVLHVSFTSDASGVVTSRELAGSTRAHR